MVIYVMNHCRDNIPLFILSFQRIMLKTMTTYGIETHHGIFCLSKKMNESQKSLCPKVLSKTIELLVPNSNEDTFNKLMTLKSLNQFLISNERNYFKGFSVDGCKFERAICICHSDNNNQTPKEFDINTLTKLQFDWNGENHVLEYSSVNTGSLGEKYIITKFDAYHPIIDSVEYKPVFGSYHQVHAAFEIINKYDATLNLTQSIQSINEHSLSNEHQLKHPFIVVEGLDGTGKSTLTENLSKHFNGIAMVTPPPSISDIRQKFDHLPEIYRRSYYALGNYIAAEEVLQYSEEKIIVMDRFWHSTTSYALANEVGCGTMDHIPPKNHTIYKWPKDLLYPSAIIFLTTKEKERDLRVNERRELTPEEKHISSSHDFRARILGTYKRISHEKWIEVDTSGTQEETLEKTIKALHMNGIC